MGKEGVSEGEGEGAHTPPFEGERERDIDPVSYTHLTLPTTPYV